MKTVFLLFTTDAWHTKESKDLICVADSKDQAINMAQMYVEAEGKKLNKQDLTNLKNLYQTQGCNCGYELLIETTQLNIFIS